MNVFRVNVADLVHRPGARRRERLSGPVGDVRVVDTAVPPGTEAVVDTLLEWVSEGVLATGTVSAVWRSQCRRCLTAVVGEARAEFRELFEDEPREGESYALRHEQVDLEPLARDALLLELPLAPLCREACEGLCPVCGVDRNVQPCGHRDETRDPRWAALDELFAPGPGEDAGADG